MTEHASNVAVDRDAAEGEDAGGIDFDNLRDIVGFALRATRRRPRMAVMTFVVVSALGLTIAATMPRIYNSQVKLLAQRSAIHALTGQNTQMDDNPTKNVAAMILRRDNLVTLAKEANLARRFEETRPAALRLKDRVMARLFGVPSEADKQKTVVLTLEKNLEVTVTEDSTVTISVDWSNPQLAYDLVTLVQKNFLEARYDSDVAVINDSIAVLEEHAKSELAHVDTELDEYQTIVAARAPKQVAPAVLAPRDPADAVARPRGVTESSTVAGPGSADIAKELEEKRLQIRATEQARERTIDALTQQLSQAQLTLTPMHPTVIALQQQLAAMNEPPPELVQMRKEERSLMAQIAPPRIMIAAPPSRSLLAPRPSLAQPDADAQAPSAAMVMAMSPATPMDRDGPLQLAQSELELAIRAYEDALVRLDATKVELDITGAAYKHRYTVVTPAEVPKGPKKATAQLVGIGAVVGGAALALLLAAGFDVLGGLVLESWQVRRRLKLDVLGELDNPS